MDESNIRSVVGARIAAARAAKGWTQTQLLQAVLGSARGATASNWESGARTPDATTLTRIAKALDVTTDYLLGMAEEPRGRVERHTDEVDDFVEQSLRFVRQVNGYEGADEEEVRRIKADILAGMVKLARKRGMDPTRLEEELAKLGGHAAVDVPPAPSTHERILTILDRDSQAALVRDEAIRELAVAARIDAQEGRERRVQVATVQKAPSYVISELTPDERAALELVEREERGGGARPVPGSTPPPPADQPEDHPPKGRPPV